MINKLTFVGIVRWSNGDGHCQKNGYWFLEKCFFTNNFDSQKFTFASENGQKKAKRVCLEKKIRNAECSLKCFIYFFWGGGRRFDQ